MGGADVVVERARAAEDDPRWAAELLNHVVFADPAHGEARELLAGVYRRLGQGAENATWRNFFLTGSLELQQGVRAGGPSPGQDLLLALTPEQVFDSMAIRLDGPGAAAAGFEATIDWHLTDDDRWIRLTVRHGVLVHQPVDGPTDGADARYALTRSELLPLVAGFTTRDPDDGDASTLDALRAHLDRFDPQFRIVEP
jgi:alkyl sulfatase BDS1-like metallo-beta-lactamase superfamily hydrolase